MGSSVRQTILHIPAILAPDLEQCVGDLAQRAHAHRVHQHLEDVGVGDHRVAQPLQRRGRGVLVALMEIGEPRKLAFLLLRGRA